MQKLDIAFWIDGGLGKNIALSGVLSKIGKEKNIGVISAYPEVYFNNNFVYRNFHHNHAYLYEDYLKNIPVVKQDPYLTNDYRLSDTHLIEAYSKIVGTSFDEDCLPSLFLTEQEESESISSIKKDIGKFVILHIAGGASYYDPNSALQKKIKSRDWKIEEAQSFVSRFTTKYPSIKIVQIGLPTEYKLKGVINMTNLSVRQIFPLIKYCETFVIIDGFLNHVSAAFKKSGIVLWGGTSPNRLGYKHNINIINETIDKDVCPCYKSDVYTHLGGKELSCRYDNRCMEHNHEIVSSKVDEILSL